MLKCLFPRIARHDLLPILWVAVTGGLIGGAYGAVHDQVTYSISPEYFTNLKFQQFHYADFGLGNRVFASTIGFFATWWVGAIAAWFLGRRLIPGQPRGRAYRQIRIGIAWVCCCGFSCGVLGYVYGVWRGPTADYSLWENAFQQYQIADRWAFVRVAYIHNAGYLGGAVGLLLALAMIRPTMTTPDRETRAGHRTSG